jgi:Transmembrane protein 43
MFIGTALVFNPLKVLADVLPLAGRIVGAGTGFIAFLLSAVSATTIIALSWLWYRPLLGIALLALALGGLFLIKKAFKKAA